MKKATFVCLIVGGWLGWLEFQSQAQSLSLAQALDATNLVWTTGGNTNWVAETDVTYDGVDAAQSGVIKTNQETWVQTTVVGPGTVSFWWYLDLGINCPYNNLDFLQFYINDVLAARVSD